MTVTEIVELVVLIVDFAIKVVAVGVVPEGRKPAASNAWLLLILFVPLVGLPLFLLLGRPYVNRRRKELQQEATRRAAEVLADLPTVPDDVALPPGLRTVLELNRSLTAMPCLPGITRAVSSDYRESIEALAAAIDRARHHVHIEIYIVSWDEVTDPVFAAMARAVARGVTVRLLLDHIGSLFYPGFRRLGRRLDEIGVQWRYMLPIQPLRGHWRRPDLRNHRKLVVIDDDTAFLGSLNLIAPWYGSRRNRERGRLWEEVNLAFGGDAVSAVQAVFALDWYKETGERLPVRAPTAHGWDAPGVNAFQVVPSGPGYRTEPNLRMFTALIQRARRRVVMISPYFVPEESLMAAVTSAAFAGLDVQLFVNEQSDQFMVGHAQASYYTALLESGVRIFQYPSPRILHAKFVTIDDTVAVIGSSNLDMRSFGLSFEISLLAATGDLVTELNTISDGYRQVCAELHLEQWRRRPLLQRYLDNALRLTAPLQ